MQKIQIKFENRCQGIDSCLDYYSDFHRALRGLIPSLFIARFDQVIHGFPHVVARFNEYFGTDYVPLQHDNHSLQYCFDVIDNSYLGPDNKPVEQRTSRPSTARQSLKSDILHQLQTSATLKRKLDRANELYLEFHSHSRSSNSNSTTLALPTLSGC